MSICRKCGKEFPFAKRRFPIIYCEDCRGKSRKVVPLVGPDTSYNIDTNIFDSKDIKEKYSILEREYLKQSKTKAKKDVAGDLFEKLRHSQFKDKNQKPIKGNIYGVDVDLYLKNSNGDIFYIEEDKGSYVDKCFAGRLIGDFLKIISRCVRENKIIPKFNLVCPTRYNLFEKTLEEQLEISKIEYVDIFRKCFSYHYHCKHDRDKDRKFILDNDLLSQDNDFIDEIIENAKPNNNR